MNSYCIIYHDSANVYNLDTYKNTNEVNTDLFISKRVMDIMYNSLPQYAKNAKRNVYKYKTLLNFFIRGYVLTSLAYTYYITKENFIRISPYFLNNLFEKKKIHDLQNEITTGTKFITFYKNNKKFFSDYIELFKSGTRNIKTSKNYISLYKIKDSIKDISNNLENDLFYVISTDVLNKLKDIENECENVINPFVSENKTETFMDCVLFKLTKEICNFSSFENYCDVKDKDLLIRKPNKRKKEAIVTNIKIYKEDLYKSLTDSSLFSSSSEKRIIDSYIDILNFYYKNFKNVNEIKFPIQYYEHINGRYYSFNSKLQCISSLLRNSLLGNHYYEIDCKSASYTLLRELSKLYNYNGDTTEIDNLIADSTTYRKNLISENITYEDIKNLLTALSLGSTFHSISFNKELKNKRLKTLIDKELLNKCLYKIESEMKSLIDFLIEYSTKNINGKKYLYNIKNQVFEINNEVTRGQKITHIYHGVESYVLKNIMTMPFRNKTLLDFTGLLLHDGFFVEKEIIIDKKTLLENIEEYVYENTNLNIKLCIKG